MTAEGAGTSVPGAQRPGRLRLRPPQEPPGTRILDFWPLGCGRTACGAACSSGRWVASPTPGAPPWGRESGASRGPAGKGRSAARPARALIVRGVARPRTLTPSVQVGKRGRREEAAARLQPW